MREALSMFPMMYLPTIALLLFMVIFFSVLYMLVKKVSPEYVSKMASMPLNEDVKHEQQ